MPMIVKSYTVSNGLSTSRERNGVTTDRTVWSEPGLKAELMLLPKGEWKVSGKPERAHVSIVFEIEHVPTGALSDIEGWLRAELAEMLEEDEE